MTYHPRSHDEDHSATPTSRPVPAESLLVAWGSACILGWLLALVMAAPISVLLDASIEALQPGRVLASLAQSVVIGGVVGLTLGRGQADLLATSGLLCHQDWPRASGYGGMLGGLALWGLTLAEPQPVAMPITLWAAVYLGPLGLAQWVACRHLPGAWLWPLASLISGVVFSGVLWHSGHNLASYALAVLGQALTLGIIADWLFRIQIRHIPHHERYAS